MFTTNFIMGNTTTTFITNVYYKNNRIIKCDIMSVTMTKGFNVVEITKYLGDETQQFNIDRTEPSKIDWIINSPKHGLILENLGICKNIFSLSEEKFRKQLIFTKNTFVSQSNQYEEIAQYIGNTPMLFDGEKLSTEGPYERHSLQSPRIPNCGAFIFTGILSSVYGDFGVEICKSKPIKIRIDPSLKITHNGNVVNNDNISLENGTLVYVAI